MPATGADISIFPGPPTWPSTSTQSPDSAFTATLTVAHSGVGGPGASLRQLSWLARPPWRTRRASGMTRPSLLWRRFRTSRRDPRRPRLPLLLSSAADVSTWSSLRAELGWGGRGGRHRRGGRRGGGLGSEPRPSMLCSAPPWATTPVALPEPVGWLHAGERGRGRGGMRGRRGRKPVGTPPHRERGRGRGGAG